MDDEKPGFPGGVRNPSGFDFHVQYEIVDGVDIKLLNYSGEGREQAFAPTRRAAKRVQRFGVKAIVGECGHFSIFQNRLANEMDIPVFKSSLLQVEWAKQSLSRNRFVGVLVSNTLTVTATHFEAVGIQTEDRVIIRGARYQGECPALDTLWHAAKRATPPRVTFSNSTLMRFVDSAINHQAFSVRI